MADYFSVINGAVAALGPEAAAQRRDIYNRARRVMIERLRMTQPPLSDAEIEAERIALESAIQRVVW